MRHRTQLYPEESQYRWLKQQQARQGVSIAQLVRDLIDSARAHRPSMAGDPLIRHLLEEPPAEGASGSCAADHLQLRVRRDLHCASDGSG
jgi:hypothetical protein